jgi:hypothetical protein
MQKRKLGNSNLEVSAIGLGCMGLGSRGSYRSPAPRSCIAWTRTSERLASNWRPMISATSMAPFPGSRCKGIGIPRTWRQGWAADPQAPHPGSTGGHRALVGMT